MKTPAKTKVTKITSFFEKRAVVEKLKGVAVAKGQVLTKVEFILLFQIDRG